jgi:N-formylglutamate amidohydrolase
MIPNTWKYGALENRIHAIDIAIRNLSHTKSPLGRWPSVEQLQKLKSELQQVQDCINEAKG